MTFSELWNADSDRFEPDAGTYHVKVVEADAFYSKKGTACVKVALEVLEGEHAGQTFDHMMYFTDGNKVGAAINRENLVMYGVDPTKIDTFEDLIGLIDRIEGTISDVSVKINGAWTDIDVLSSRTGESDVPAEQPQLATPEGDKPTSFAAAANVPHRFGDDPPYD